MKRPAEYYYPHATVSAFLKEKGQEIPPEIVSHFILKGGTGKTVLNVNYAYWPSERSPHPVLLIDLDGEACASNMLLKDDANLDNLTTIYEILKNDLQIKDHVLPTKYPNLFILPAKMKALKSSRFAHGKNPKTLLRRHMKSLSSNFGSIVLDMPPTINQLTTSALLIITKLVIPINPDIFSIESLYLTLDEIKESTEEYECQAPSYCILMNKFQTNTIASSDAYREVTKNFGDKLIPLQLKLSAQINNAVNDGRIIEKDFKRAYSEIASFITSLKGKERAIQ